MSRCVEPDTRPADEGDAATAAVESQRVLHRQVTSSTLKDREIQDQAWSGAVLGGQGRGGGPTSPLPALLDHSLEFLGSHIGAVWLGRWPMELGKGLGSG